MNKNQRRILWMVAVVLFLMLLFPPFRYSGSAYRPRNQGYGFILAPPHRDAVVNHSLLATQWVGILLVGGILLVLAADPLMGRDSALWFQNAYSKVVRFCRSQWVFTPRSPKAALVFCVALLLCSVVYAWIMIRLGYY